MTSPEGLARQADLVAAVRAARERRDDLAEQHERAKRDFRRAIHAAYDSGARTADIAAAAGLSRQRVHQIWVELGD